MRLRCARKYRGEQPWVTTDLRSDLGEESGFIARRRRIALCVNGVEMVVPQIRVRVLCQPRIAARVVTDAAGTD